MRVTFLALFLTATPVLATSFARPVREDVFSRNHAYVLDVNPQTQTHTVYDVRDRTKPLWSFSCVVWQSPFLLSDDGQVVATVGWMFVREQDIAEAEAVTFWNKGGEFRSHALRDVCPNPVETGGRGPIGAFWRTWYDKVENHGDSFTVRTTVGVTYRFRYADGELVERWRLDSNSPSADWKSAEREPFDSGGGWLVAGVIATVIAAAGAVVVILWRRRD